MAPCALHPHDYFLAGDDELPGLPGGLWASTLRRAELISAWLRSIGHPRPRLDVRVLLRHLLLPLVTDEATGDHEPVHQGSGFLHIDVSPDDADIVRSLQAEHANLDAIEFAHLAQLCRVPITPYRAFPTSPPAGNPQISPPAPNRIPSVELAHKSVLDLTTMWAGPLCAHLLGELGVQISKVEPNCRPDGLRQSPAHFHAINDHPHRRLDLDLRVAADRAVFEAQVAKADLLIESFTRRVMPNFGYTQARLREINPQLHILAIRAFPLGNEFESWGAYGGGVHAWSGLGGDPSAPQSAPFSYPDPLTGLDALSAALHMLLASPDDGPLSTEVTLAASVMGLRPLQPPTANGDGLGRLARGLADTRGPLFVPATEDDPDE